MVEVEQPKRQQRRGRGESDPIDAHLAHCRCCGWMLRGCRCLVPTEIARRCGSCSWAVASCQLSAKVGLNARTARRAASIDASRERAICGRMPRLFIRAAKKAARKMFWSEHRGPRGHAASSPRAILSIVCNLTSSVSFRISAAILSQPVSQASRAHRQRRDGAKRGHWWRGSELQDSGGSNCRQRLGSALNGG